MRSLIIFLLCFSCCFQITFSQDNLTTWTGNVSSDWDNSDNWTDGVPNSVWNSHAIIPSEPEGNRFPVIDEAATGSAAIVSQFGNLQINGALNCTSFNGYNNSATNLSDANFTCQNLKLQEGSSMVMENDSNVEAENFVLENDSHVLVKDVSKFSHDNTQINEGCSVVIEGWDRSLNGGNLKVYGVLSLLAGTFLVDKGVETGTNSTVTISGDNTVFVFSGDTDEEDFNCDGTVNVQGGNLIALDGRKFNASWTSEIVVTGGYFSILDLFLKGALEVDGGEAFLQNTEVDIGSTVSVKDGKLEVSGDLENAGKFEQEGGSVIIQDNFINDETVTLKSGELQTSNLTNNSKLKRSDTHTLDVTGTFTNNGEVEYSSSKEVNDGETTSFSLDGDPFIDFTPIDGSLGETTVVFNSGSTCPDNAFGSGCPAAPLSITRFYDIKPAQKKKAVLKFYYFHNELNGQNHGSSLKLFNYDSLNGVWRNAGYYDSLSGTWKTATLTSFGGSGTEEDPYYSEYTDVGSYSPFVLSSEDSPLPVELVTFTGKLIDHNLVLLEWETATEVNNFGFDVKRRSSSLTEWEKVGFVQGHGTTNSPKNYEFTDSELPNSDEVSYRLKQIDNDGTFAYTKTIIVDLTTITSVEDEEIPTVYSLEQNYPNPFNPVTTIKFGLPEDGFVDLRVYNILGQEVAKLVNKELNAGYHRVSFGNDNLSSGMYIYRINVEGKFNSVKKMLLVK